MYKGKSGVYIIKIDKYNYVGQTVNVSNRMKNHKCLLNKGTHRNTYLQNVYNKYKHFEVKVMYIEKEYLTIVEQCWINILSNTLNIMPAENTSIKRTAPKKVRFNPKCLDTLIHEKGSKHPRYQHTIYSFYNLITEEIITDTIFNFYTLISTRTTLSISSCKHTATRLAKESQLISKGWCLYKNKDKVVLPKYKCKLK